MICPYVAYQAILRDLVAKERSEEDLLVPDNISENVYRWTCCLTMGHSGDHSHHSEELAAYLAHPPDGWVLDTYTDRRVARWVWGGRPGEEQERPLQDLLDLLGLARGVR